MLTISSQSYPSKPMLFFHQLLLFLVIPWNIPHLSTRNASCFIKETSSNTPSHYLPVPRLSSIPSTSSTRHPSSVRKAD
ncbi:hypothetical protein J3F84DRAFT_376806 [Trichoderma pleuroticola]